MKRTTRKIVRKAEDLRLVADPRKLRILEALREAPASAHELALRFGVKPTALYHHFARLEDAGLIEVAEERKRRGVIERRYRAAVNQLVVDRSLARGAKTSKPGAAVLAAASAILSVTAEDINAAAVDRSRPLADADRSEIATTVVRVTPAQAKTLMKRVRSLIDLANRYDGAGEQRVRVTLVAVPIIAT